MIAIGPAWMVCPGRSYVDLGNMSHRITLCHPKSQGPESYREMNEKHTQLQYEAKKIHTKREPYMAGLRGDITHTVTYNRPTASITGSTGYFSFKMLSNYTFRKNKQKPEKYIEVLG